MADTVSCWVEGKTKGVMMTGLGVGGTWQLAGYITDACRYDAILTGLLQCRSDLRRAGWLVQRLNTSLD